METVLLQAMERGDTETAVAAFDEAMRQGRDPWEIHLALFPAVQEILNPPFINPHLPKMYAIVRELAARVESGEAAPLVRLEIAEYARRPRLEKLAKPVEGDGGSSFADVEEALAGDDRRETARRMASFHARHGSREFSRRMLLLGSGYLDSSLGHSTSCTAFILLEGMGRPEEDPWPLLSALADYFHKGGFVKTPELDPAPVPDEELEHHLLRAGSGRGIVNLHHPITLYAIDRVRHLFAPEEHHHLLRAWVSFLGDKEAKEGAPLVRGRIPESYADFLALFGSMEARPTLDALWPLFATPEGRACAGNYLVRALCDRYRGNYNPHYLTGLGALLWLAETFPQHPRAVHNALHQYLDYYFTALSS